MLIFASWSWRDREEKEDGGVARVDVCSVPGHRRQVHERVGVHAKHCEWEWYNDSKQQNG